MWTLKDNILSDPYRPNGVIRRMIGSVDFAICFDFIKDYTRCKLYEEIEKGKSKIVILSRQSSNVTCFLESKVYRQLKWK